MHANKHQPRMSVILKHDAVVEIECIYLLYANVSQFGEIVAKVRC